ncbi:MAG: hypothetical protein K9K63_16435 [Desulfotignum sp.]|nr:hypothetical protein [Desulfotignum sp.]MCF8089813.1 hypothetical protein [Desulfotignum sp.]MCF8138893.1 hypothetical protein [Desulfotignum sp.]
MKGGGAMPFVSIPGMPGRLYVPGERAECVKKFPCKDCFSCEYCSDDRCRVCRGEKETGPEGDQGV